MAAPTSEQVITLLTGGIFAKRRPGAGCLCVPARDATRVNPETRPHRAAMYQTSEIPVDVTRLLWLPGILHQMCRNLHKTCREASRRRKFASPGRQNP